VNTTCSVQLQQAQNIGLTTTTASQVYIERAAAHTTTATQVYIERAAAYTTTATHYNCNTGLHGGCCIHYNCNTGLHREGSEAYQHLLFINADLATSAPSYLEKALSFRL